MAMKSVPIRTNPELRKSRLFSSMFGYVKRSMVTIIRSFMMYKPLRFFLGIGSVISLLGAILGIRFLVYFFMGQGAGHVQSLILASTLLLMGFMTCNYRVPGGYYRGEPEAFGGCPVSCEKTGL